MAVTRHTVQPQAQKEAVLSFFSAVREALNSPKPLPATQQKLPNVIEGRNAIWEAAHMLLSREVSGHPDPCVYVSLSSPELMGTDFLPALISGTTIGKSKRLRVRHVLEVPASAKLNDESAVDIIRRLSLLTALFLNDRLDYEPFILDTDAFAYSTDGVLYPNCILFSNRALMISTDGQTALYIASDVMTGAYRRSFERIRAHTTTIETITGRPTNVFRKLAEVFSGEEQSPIFSLSYSPIFFSKYGGGRLDRYLLPDLEEREEVLRVGNSYYAIGDALPEPKRQYIYFTEEGLLDFARDGKFRGLTGLYLTPVPQEERLAMLPDQRKERASVYSILNSDVFSVPTGFSAFIASGSMVLIGQRMSDVRGIIIHDARVIRLFSDFFLGLGDSECVHSKIEQRTIWARARKRCCKPVNRE